MRVLFFSFSLMFLFASTGFAQKPVLSPPMTVTGSVDGVDITIDYSSPGVKGRTTWGGQLVPFDKVWRTGANKATWIETSGDIIVDISSALRLATIRNSVQRISGSLWLVISTILAKGGLC